MFAFILLRLLVFSYTFQNLNLVLDYSLIIQNKATKRVVFHESQVSKSSLFHPRRQCTNQNFGIIQHLRSACCQSLTAVLTHVPRQLRKVRRKPEVVGSFLLPVGIRNYTPVIRLDGGDLSNGPSLQAR